MDKILFDNIIFTRINTNLNTNIHELEGIRKNVFIEDLREICVAIRVYIRDY